MHTNKFLLFVALITFSFSLHAQSELIQLSEEEKINLTESIASASKGMNSLKCDFVQTKTISLLEEEVVSTGKMYYLKDNKLRWEYIAPYKYEFIMNEDKVLLKSENSSNVINIKTNKLFREISKIIISGVNGSDIGNSDIYDAEFYAQKDGFLVKLYPKQNELKQMFSAIHLFFNKKNFTVESIKMVEESSDITHIELKNKQLNEDINKNVFTIN